MPSATKSNVQDALNPSYPVNLIVRDQPCLVVGGGNVAIRKIDGLRRSGALVTVVAPEIRPEILSLSGIVAKPRAYQRGDVAGKRLVITCTDNPEVNAQVFHDAEVAGVWANSADDPLNCAFTLPAVAWQGDLSIAISTAGKSPALASWLRRRFESELDQGYAQLLDLLADVRAEARHYFGTSEISGWISALDGTDSTLLELIVAGDQPEARRRLRASLALPEEVLV